MGDTNDDSPDKQRERRLARLLLRAMTLGIGTELGAAGGCFDARELLT
jgi:hypothetical protein